MVVDRRKLYDDALTFFDPIGNVIMKLTPAAAISVCDLALDRHIAIVRIEGGIHEEKEGTFEARIDCIWDGIDPPADDKTVKENNSEAAAYIKGKSSVHNAFILTVAPISGYLHKRQ